MRKVLLFIILTIFAFGVSYAQQSIITFKAIGYNDNDITGTTGAANYSIAINPAFDVNGSKVVIYLQPSQALLKDRSYVNLLINNKQVYSTNLRSDSVQSITANLNKSDLSADGKHINIQLRTLLTLTGNKCQDADNPALWLKIKSTSYLAVNQSQSNFLTKVNIANSYAFKRAIVYPDKPSIHDLKALAWVYARLRAAGAQNINIYQAGQMPDSLTNFFMVGTLNQLPADKRAMVKTKVGVDQGLFYLAKDVVNITDATGTRSSGRQILFITANNDVGYEKAITTLSNDNVLNTANGNFLVINNASSSFFKHTDENRTKVSLRQIGGEPNYLSGVGSAKSTYNFKNADFSTTPRDLNIHVYGAYSGLKDGERGYCNLYLNGTLKLSQKLDGSGKLNVSFAADRFQHQKYNTLVAEFKFYPAGKGCETFSSFFSEIDVDKSYIQAKNSMITNNVDFYQYPGAFNEGTSCIVISRDYSKYAGPAMGEILYALNSNNSYNFPYFVFADQFLSDESSLDKYNIIGLIARNDQFLGEFPDAPVKFDNSYRLYNSKTNNLVYAVSDTVSSCLAQIFKGRNGNTCMFFTVAGKNIESSLLAAAKAITEQSGIKNDNVGIVDIYDNKHMFNINMVNGSPLFIETRNDLYMFWDDYNIYILIGLLALIIGSFLFIRSRIKKNTEFIKE